MHCLEMRGYLSVLLCVFGIIKLVQNASFAEADVLYKNITSGKNTALRPVLEQQHPVNVYVYFHLVYIQEFDEVSGKLSLTGIFGINWLDETVSWNATETGIQSLTYVGEEFWKPSFVIANSYGEVKHIYNDDSIKRVMNTGLMSWTTGGKYEVTCSADVSKYPFDSQKCVLMLMPWGYGDNELVMAHTLDNVMTYYYSPHSTWELAMTTVSKQNEPQILHFGFELKRQPMFFVVNLVLPIGLMSFLNVCVFLLPVESGERVGYAITVLLAIAVFLTISSDSLPATSNPRISDISILLFTDVLISAIIVVLVILGMRFYHRDDKCKISAIAIGFVTFVRKLRCECRRRKVEEEKQNKKDCHGADSDSCSSEYCTGITWTDVGRESDFIFGVLLLIILILVHVLYVVDVTVGLI